MNLEIRIFRALIYTLSIALAFAPAGIAPRAQSPSPESNRAFRVAYLREGSDFDPAERLLEALRVFIDGKTELREALRRGGYGPLRLSPCDGPRDMIRRMNAGEFDMVFATAVVYVSQAGPYGDPILQTRLEGDDQAGGREAGWQRQGVIVIGRGSSVFGKELISEDEVVRALAAEPMAVPSEFSSAGYLYPRFLLMRMGLAQPDEILFCGTDAEVVKHVAAGLVPWGACRKGVLDELVPVNVRSECLSVSWETQHFPTDPILLRDRFAPATSDIGREMKVALREFFTQQQLAPGLRIENAVARDYSRMAGELSWLAGELARLNTLGASGPQSVQPALTPIERAEPLTSATQPVQPPPVVHGADDHESPAEHGPAQSPLPPEMRMNSSAPGAAPAQPAHGDEAPHGQPTPTKPSDAPKVKVTPEPAPAPPGGQPKPDGEKPAPAESPAPAPPPAKPTAPTPKPRPVLPEIGMTVPSATGEGSAAA